MTEIHYKRLPEYFTENAVKDAISSLASIFSKLGYKGFRHVRTNKLRCGCHEVMIRVDAKPKVPEVVNVRGP